VIEAERRKFDWYQSAPQEYQRQNFFIEKREQVIRRLRTTYHISLGISLVKT